MITIAQLLDHHVNERDTCTEEERPFHAGAIRLLESLRPARYPLRCSLDVVKGQNIVDEGAAIIYLPSAPMPGEALQVGLDRYRTIGRAHVVDQAGEFTLKILVESLGRASAIKPAPATFLDTLAKAAAAKSPGLLR
jgi:hypothetical protein